MPTLALIGVLAGLITGISPCVLPVLPAVLLAGAAPSGGARPGRSVVVIAGLVVSFSLLTLAGSALLRAIDLPQNLLHIAGLVLLCLVGLGLCLPGVGELLERPFARLHLRPPRPGTGGFVLGLGLGAVYVPCAGPVLAALAVVGATDHFGAGGALLMVSFAVGAGIPLLGVALAGAGIVRRARWLAGRARPLRVAGGVVMIATSAVVGFNLLGFVQRDIPGYTTALQARVESTPAATRLLRLIAGGDGAATDTLGRCAVGVSTPEWCGVAPPFTDITAWLQTPGDRPLTWTGLRGQVVLVDFWTYSCINCQRTLPHLEAWYKQYHPYGFTIIGVHAPEFAFEHVIANVTTAAARLGIDYPIAIDNAYGTMHAYGAQYWPTEYLVDADGIVRHITIGEGDYGATEDLIRQLVAAAHPGIALPPRTDVPNLTPTQTTTPESYLGYDRLSNLVGATVVRDQPTPYTLPPALPLNDVALGGTWTIGAQEMTAGRGAELRLHYQARDVYLVLSGSGTIGVLPSDGPSQTITVSGIANLYPITQGTAYSTGTVTLKVSPGISAYDITFG